MRPQTTTLSTDLETLSTGPLTWFRDWPNPVIPADKPGVYTVWLEDLAALKTEADWIAAGREIFYGRELPRFTGSEHNLAIIRNPQVLAAYRLQTTREGVLLGLRYVVRRKGAVELGTDTCSMCHVQVRPDGTLIEDRRTCARPSAR